jgi:tetratricopeptide (TPR) repeat protein
MGAHVQPGSILFMASVFALAAAPANAADAGSAAPSIAPAPAWVDQIPIPEPNPALKDRPLQPLLVVAEGRYPKDGRTEYHVETATLVQTPEGLAALGNIVLPWQPDHAELIVNRVRILRHGQEIDLLKNGQQFTVLRRENNLEAAMLDGVLTAAMQPEGLSVGDVLDISFTIRLKPQTVPFRPEDISMLSHGFPIRRLHYRQMWENGLDLKWASTETMGKPKLSRTGWGTELLLDRTDAEPPEAPRDAPPRFLQPARIELTGYADWSDISRLLAPVFASASQLAPDSPIGAEIGRIAGASQDPKQRAMAALRLVQDNVRYFALAMGDSGYVPAKPDLTWSRKFGDCKGKTVLLLAMLSGLGIEAEPVLVSSSAGDSLSVRLPQVSAFDHVIVRATIGGHSYWLDGTRSGDRDIEALASSPFVWGLPLRTAGARLEPLPRTAPTQPLFETRITYDASKGFFGPVPATGEQIFRGDMAAAMRLAMRQLGPDEFRRKMRTAAPDEIKSDDVQVDFADDEAHGAFTLTFKGTQQMEWAGSPGGKRVLFRFDNDTIKWEPDFKRDEGPGKDVPFALVYPVYLASSETIILPRGGAGFTLEGKSFDRIVDGTRIERHIALENGRATAQSIFQRLKPEVEAAEARASVATLKEISADVAGVRSPADYQLSETERQALLGRETTTAQGYNERGYQFLQRGQLTKALADFDKAFSMSPEWALPLANRGVVLVHQHKLDEAEKALRKAQAINDSDAIVHQGLGLLAAERDKPAEAIEEFTRALQIEPDNAYNLGQRAALYEGGGRFRDALADVERRLPTDTDKVGALRESARLHAMLGEQGAALEALDKAIALKPDDSALIGYRGEMLARFGRKEEALKSYADSIRAFDKTHNDPHDIDGLRGKIAVLALAGKADVAVATATAALATHPANAELLIGRCDARVTGGIDVDRALKDCSDALYYSDGNTEATILHGMAELKMQRGTDALADFDKAVSYEPHNARALYGRGLARQRNGDKEGADRDFAAARRYGFDVAVEYDEIGLRP